VFALVCPDRDDDEEDPVLEFGKDDEARTPLEDSAPASRAAWIAFKRASTPDTVFFGFGGGATSAGGGLGLQGIGSLSRLGADQSRFTVRKPDIGCLEEDIAAER
jgi:hypothetical protein